MGLSGKKTDVRQRLAQRLRGARALRRLSQMELARRAKVSRPVVSALEQGRGNPSLLVMDRLSKALGYDLVDLLTQNSKSSNQRSFPSEGVKRYSGSGRKPSLANWLEHPPVGSKTYRAKEFGVDLTLLAQTLALTPTQRLQKAQQAAALLRTLRKGAAR